MNRSSTSNEPHGAIQFLERSRSGGLIGLAVVVGAGAGAGAVLFRWLIGTAQHLFFNVLGERWLAGLGPYQVVLVPAAGGLLVGPLIYFLAREAKGHGVPEVMYSVALEGGRIRPRVAVIKSLASSLCIGSGGSAGREGPIVQIGSALGSTLGQLLHLHAEHVRLLVACGAAGGISATFNAPIAGVIFAIEVILRQISVPSFGAVVLASVMSSVVSRMAYGNTPAFAVPTYALVSAWELAFHFVLGVLCAFLAVGFVRALYGCEDLWDRWRRVPEYVKPVLGGLIVGAMGVWVPQVFGVGYGPIEIALRGDLSIWLAVGLVALKLAATSTTIGSGGSGGVFAPSLFIGAMAGNAFGQAVSAWFPGLVAAPGAYAVVGMAAVFAAAAHAPLTSILILFEMTGDYAIILPLMTGVVVAATLAQRLQRENIYTLKLLRRGIDISVHRDVNLMDTILVDEAMTRQMDTVPSAMPVSQLIHEFEATWHHGFPVVDDGRLVGIVSLTDIAGAAIEDGRELRVGDICTRDVITCHPDETLSEALRQFGARDVGRLPVVDRRDHARLLGVLRRGDIVSAYARASVDHADHLARVERAKQVTMPEADFVEVELGSDSPLVGKSVAELRLPRECVLVAARRGAHTILPHGDTVLKPKDRLWALCQEGAVEQFRRAALKPEESPKTPAGRGEAEQQSPRPPDSRQSE